MTSFITTVYAVLKVTIKTGRLISLDSSRIYRLWGAGSGRGASGLMKSLLLCSLVFPCILSLAGEPNLVYLVRHAEKVDESRDADLSFRGFRRADNLRYFFQQIPLTTIYASQYKRTQKTVLPTAWDKRLEVAVIDAGQSQQLVDQIRRQSGQTVLVAGHSNTIPELVCLMGGPELVIRHGDYSDIILLIIHDDRCIIQRFQVDP